MAASIWTWRRVFGVSNFLFAARSRCVFCDRVVWGGSMSIPSALPVTEMLSLLTMSCVYLGLVAVMSESCRSRRFSICPAG